MPALPIQLIRLFFLVFLCWTASLALARSGAAQVPNTSAVSACQWDDSRPWLEAARNQRQTQFLLCAAVGIAIVGLLTWFLPAASGEVEESVGVTLATLLILADFILVILTGMDLLGRSDGRALLLLFLCIAAALPHLIAVLFVMVNVIRIPHGVSKTRAFIAGLGLLAPVLFVLSLVIDSNWDFSKLSF